MHIDHQRSAFGPCELCQIETRGRRSTDAFCFHLGYIQGEFNEQLGVFKSVPRKRFEPPMGLFFWWVNAEVMRLHFGPPL